MANAKRGLVSLIPAGIGVLLASSAMADDSCSYVRNWGFQNTEFKNQIIDCGKACQPSQTALRCLAYIKGCGLPRPTWIVCPVANPSETQAEKGLCPTEASTCLQTAKDKIEYTPAPSTSSPATAAAPAPAPATGDTSALSGGTGAPPSANGAGPVGAPSSSGTPSGTASGPAAVIPPAGNGAPPAGNGAPTPEQDPLGVGASPAAGDPPAGNGVGPQTP